MKFLKCLLVILVILVNLVVAQPSLAEPNRTKVDPNMDLTEITQKINSLLMTKATELDQIQAEKIQNQIDQLEFEKYVLESGQAWGQCRNETGKILAIYGQKPKKSGSDYENTIYFLPDGKTTKKQWDCDGVYIPNDVKVTGITPNSSQNQEIESGLAVKIYDGTNLVVQTNPQTKAIEFNINPAKVFKAGEVNWFIPNVSQAMIDIRVPDAPMQKS